MTTTTQLADALQKPSGTQEGYVAERHPSFPDLVVVWAPCDCYWIGPIRAEGPLVTMCGKKDCVFEWIEVEHALLALKAAEESQKASPKSGIHISRPLDVNTLAAGRNSESEKVIENQVTDMISEGGPVET